MSTNLEEILFDINKKFININKYKERYAGHFNELTNIIFKKMREEQPFGYLFHGFQLGGSYGDNLKVTKPNEFDLVFHIRFPDNDLIIVHKDECLAGNVQLDMSRVMPKIAKERQNAAVYKWLQKWTNNDHCLVVEKLQAYFNSCFIKALQCMNYKIISNNTEATLAYRRSGPAHTISVDGGSSLQYDVDFVPGLLLDKCQSILSSVCGRWEAIPKPIVGALPMSISFRASYYREEQKLIKDKGQLKNALRLMKKFRDAHSNMQKMKSYFIKTIFLWKVYKTEETNYWHTPLYKIIIDMFEEMESTLLCGKLEFFWHPALNLYAQYSQSLLTEMWKCVHNARRVLENANNGLILPLYVQGRIYKIFLETDEYCPRVETYSCDCVKASNVQCINDALDTSFPENDDPPSLCIII